MVADPCTFHCHCAWSVHTMQPLCILLLCPWIRLHTRLVLHMLWDYFKIFVSQILVNLVVKYLITLEKLYSVLESLFCCTVQKFIIYVWNLLQFCFMSFVQKAAKKRKFQVIVVECAPDCQVRCFFSTTPWLSCFNSHFLLHFSHCFKASCLFHSWYYQYLPASLLHTTLMVGPSVLSVLLA